MVANGLLEKQVITLAVRTPLTKARKGGLKDTNLDELLVSLLTVRNPGTWGSIPVSLLF